MEYKKDADDFEKQVEKLKKQLQTYISDKNRCVNLENENEALKTEMRHLSCVAEDWEAKFDT